MDFFFTVSLQATGATFILITLAAAIVPLIFRRQRQRQQRHREQEQRQKAMARLNPRTSTPASEKHAGLLTPPSSPPVTTMTDPNPYPGFLQAAFLQASLPEEFANAPPELLQELLFGDMDGELWNEVLHIGGSFSDNDSGIVVNTSFGSVSSLDLDEVVSVGSSFDTVSASSSAEWE